MDQLILVGDIIDLQAMQARAWWHPLHTACVQRVLKLLKEQRERRELYEQVHLSLS